MGCKFSDVVRFDLGPLFQGQTRLSKLKSANNSHIIDPRALQHETNLSEIMGFEFSDVRFDLEPPLEGQTTLAKLKSTYNSLIIVPRGFQCETNR